MVLFYPIIVIKAVQEGLIYLYQFCYIVNDALPDKFSLVQ